MKRLRNYIIDNLSLIFMSIFVSLFTIASMIFLIKIATYTAVIQLSVWEMTKLYLFNVPELLFYTLPITFFVAAALALFRLSNENEMIVIFSLGIKPSFVLKTLFKPALLLSILLFINFFLLFPHSKVLAGNFISYKKSEAQFNLSASEFGNSFGDWLLYLGEKKEDGTFSKVFLFNKKKEEEILIAARNAKLVNDSGVLRLKLYKGQGYSYSKEKFTQINFDTMIINDTMKTELTTYRAPLEYWRSKERRKAKDRMLITDTLLSLFPILSLFFVASIGIVHARHQKSQVYLFLFLGVIFYYGMSFGLQKSLGFYTIPTVAILWTLSTYLFYRKRIATKF
jgi:lipopolysaccharide export system permease protein